MSNLNNLSKAMHDELSSLRKFINDPAIVNFNQTLTTRINSSLTELEMLAGDIKLEIMKVEESAA